MNNTKFCPNCGNEVAASATFCPKCGTHFPNAQQKGSQLPVTRNQAPVPQNQGGGLPPQRPNAPMPDGPNNNGPKSHLTTWIGLAVVVALLAIVTGYVLIQQQAAAKQQAEQQSEQSSVARVQSSKKAASSKLADSESTVSDSAVDVVTDIVQNKMDLDAKCTDVTITSHSGDQYYGYADVKDDDGDSATVDITATDVKYKDDVSVEISSDGSDTLNDKFNSTDDNDDYDTDD